MAVRGESFHPFTIMGYVFGPHTELLKLHFKYYLIIAHSPV